MSILYAQEVCNPIYSDLLYKIESRLLGRTVFKRQLTIALQFPSLVFNVFLNKINVLTYYYGHLFLTKELSSNMYIAFIQMKMMTIRSLKPVYIVTYYIK